MIQKNLSLKDLEIITTISNSSKSKVSLVSMKGTKDLAILKQYTDKQSLCCYEQLTSLKSAYLPEIYSMWEENENFFLLEEYISGITLQEKMENNLSFSESELFELAKHICMALHDLHNANPPIIHRDIKPENIIILSEGNIKLIDFDAAREYKINKEHDTIMMGTKEYASPEQYGFMQTDIRSDIYSFGIVFAEMLFHATVSKRFEAKARKIINRATMFDPKERYSNTSILLKDLSLMKKKKINLILCLFVSTFICILIVIVLFVNSDKETNLVEPSLTFNNTENPESLTTITTETEEFISKETLSLNEAYNYVDILDEVDPKAFYLMENNGYLFDGIPTSGMPDGMYSMNQECFIGSDYATCRFLKGYPRDLVFCDFRVKNITEIYIYPYLEESKTNGEKITLTSNDYVQNYDNVVSISKNFLETLEPGGYTLYLNSANYSFPLYLIVHSKEDKVDKFYPRPINEIGYYSSKKQNDVLFYTTGTPYPIKEVRMNNSTLDPQNYTLVDGGYGIIFKPDFLEQWKNLESFEMIYVTENDREGGIRIINISNF